MCIKLLDKINQMYNVSSRKRIFKVPRQKLNDFDSTLVLDNWHLKYYPMYIKESEDEPHFFCAT